MRAATLGAFFAAIQELRAAGLLLAYHDRSDGGLFVTLCEMAFAGRAGLDVQLATWHARQEQLGALFAEELGAVIQVRDADSDRCNSVLGRHGLGSLARRVADRHQR